jgi:hypothetical protein
MREAHVTAETLQRLHRQELEPAELLAVLRHLPRCSECARLAEPALPPRLTLDEEPDSAPRHLDPETQLFPWLDGNVDAAEREIIETHVEDCPMCRAEADDLRRMRRPVHRVPSRRWWAIAAAVVLAVAGFLAIRQLRSADVPRSRARPQASVRPGAAVSYANKEWNRLVAEAVRTRRLPFAQGLEALRPLPDPLRGGAEDVSGSLSPAGVVVMDARPRFSWAAADDATYVVSVFDGPSEVMTSEVLATTSWTAPTDLPEERTLTWQVEVTQRGRRFIVPAPPAPPALFRVASREHRADIENARRRHPADHLLHAVLYARAGLVAEANAALRRAAADGDPRAHAISAR